VHPHLLNSCDDLYTVTVFDSYANGSTAYRYFHLRRNEDRPVAAPSYQSTISGQVPDLVQKGADGSNFVSIYKIDIGGTKVWMFKNESPDRISISPSSTTQHGASKLLLVCR
jgi:hypothetical protein